MINLTITIWQIIDGNDPEKPPNGQTPSNEQRGKESGTGTSPPEK